MKYLYETHFHTDEVSPCGKVPAARGIEMYKDAGYSGVMITDHFSTSYMTEDYPGSDWKEKMDYYLRGYHEALKTADDDFAVILGMELRLPQNGNDYLLFGLKEDWLYEHEWFCETDIKQFKKTADEEGITIIQAHPFRKNMTIVEPKYIHGIEVFNGNKRHDSSNRISMEWAKRHELIMTSGSDFHQPEDYARGGIYLDHKVTDAAGLRAAILRGGYTLKVPGERQAAFAP